MTAVALPAMEVGDDLPTAVYRFYDADGGLLYVGITGNLKGRFAQHATDKPWWPDVARKTVEWYPSRADALTAESAAIKDERPVHNIAGADRPAVRRPRRPPPEVRASRNDDDTLVPIDPGDPPPDYWPPDYWGLEWWRSDHASNAAQYEFLEIFGCPERDAMDAFGLWHFERRQGNAAHPLVWLQRDSAPPGDVRGKYPYSAHADITCAEPWSEFTPDIALAQERFLYALHDAGYCQSVHPGPAAAAFGFAHQLEAQITGAILSELAWGRADVAERSTDALRREVAVWTGQLG